MITAQNKEHRLQLAQWVLTWNEAQKSNLVCGDEFYFWVTRKPNSKNDIIWGRSKEEVAEQLKSPQIAHPQCVGVCIFFQEKICFILLKVRVHHGMGTILEIL